MKKIVFAGMVVLAAAFARADFLYWQIADQGDFTMANLWVKNTGSSAGLEVLDTILAEAVAADETGATLTGTTTGLVETDLGQYASDEYSFFVELATYSSADATEPSSQKWLNSYSYDQLVSGGYISTGAVGVPSPATLGGAPMSGGGFAIPEPTSGMLMLLGGALMALRRRRA
jgi:hypothetical protein